MGSHYVLLVNQLLICLSFFAALLLFQYGFLLKRHEIRSQSNCSDVSYTRDVCWLPAQYKRAILIVVDALRYDFAAPPHYSHHSGNLPIITKLISSKNDSAVLTRFIADPPTTTLQRLKGLTTGSLPTFIDVASNFASSEIQEDNWIDQICSSGRNITFLGDDTWVSLFPSRFHRSFHLPSFDINDLNRVDDFILENLFIELARPDWSILIAHFLGVDHCGHKYGPDHPEMINKLSQMDEVIGRVINVMDNETLLVVLGDHGMTETGDHGGDAQLELDAALFLFSKKKLVFSSFPDSVSQVDLVPTLSLLLDSPIPFSNIGIVIDALIPYELRSLALSSNVWQMDRYAHLMADEIPDLYVVLREFEAKEESDTRNIKLMRKLQQLFRFSWTHFSHPFMRVGLESITEAIFGIFDAYFQAGKITPGWIIFRSALFFVQISAYLNGSETGHLIALLEAILVSSLIFHFISFFNKLLSFSFSVWYIFGVLLIIVHGLSFLSNSYIVFESSSIRFLVQTALVIAFIYDMPRVSKRSWKRFLTFRSFCEKFFSQQHIVMVFLILLLLRFGKLFERCREEQQSACYTTFLSQPSGKLQEGYEKIFRFMLGVVFLVSKSIYARKNLRNFSTLLSAFIFPTVVAVIASWLAQLLPDKLSGNFTSFAQFSSQILYFLVVWNITFVCFMSRSQDLDLLFGYSMFFMFYISLYLCLLLGDSLSVSYIIFISIVLLITDIIRDELFLLVLYVLLTSHGFFALSHQATFSSIPWQAGFIGVQGNFFIQAVPATLIISHLFSSHISVAAVLPYSLALHAKSDPFRNVDGLIRRSSLFLFLHAFQVLCICVAAFIHRRHLMVWKIFAPKFVFEAVSFLMLCLVVTFVNIIFRNMNRLKVVKRTLLRKS